jgi:16S rRNA G966 N2-methylase RsmD
MKITGGYLKSRKIDFPKGVNVRPTLSQIRESVFSILSCLIDFEESSFLDVFAGSGIIILEHPKSLEVDFNGFKLLKQKIYADKAISFLRFAELS